MAEQESSPKRRLQKKSGLTILFIILTLIISAAALIYLFFPSSIQSLKTTSDQKISEILASNTSPEPLPDSEPLDTADSSIETPSPDQIAHDTNKITTDSSASESSSLVVPVVPGQKEKLDSTCTVLSNNIDLFFSTLDDRPYINDFNITEKSAVYFPKLIQRLIDNPPVVSGETDDLFTVLQNTAHFFRIIGKQNIHILKGILDRETMTFEQVLADFYQLTKNPECLKEHFNLTIPNDSLYLYSGFFLNTMGGRLYLFRRDSMSRMVVNYYALVVMDQANREGRNKFGIVITEGIDNLIKEIESSKVDFQLRETYLDTLYNMKEKYQ